MAKIRKAQAERERKKESELERERERERALWSGTVTARSRVFIEC